jgi:S-adenosylmethionine/arginine decarboxylase-like enzyme
MRNLAPGITRQRLLLEGYYTVEMDERRVEDYLQGVAAHLGLRGYGRPAIFAPAGEGSPDNQGFDAFLPLIDSGISLYVWTSARFVAVVLFTCKAFDETSAIEFTREFLRLTEVEADGF